MSSSGGKIRESTNKVAQNLDKLTKDVSETRDAVRDMSSTVRPRPVVRLLSQRRKPLRDGLLGKR